MVHSDACTNTCKFALRPNVLLCGTSSYDIKKQHPGDGRHPLLQQRDQSCSDRLPSVVQFTPGDPIWAAIPFQAITGGEAGCGHAINGFPMVTPIAGWNAQNAAVGCRDLMLGRLWLTDFDWQDSMPNVNMTFTDTMMGCMPTHNK